MQTVADRLSAQVISGALGKVAFALSRFDLTDIVPQALGRSGLIIGGRPVPWVEEYAEDTLLAAIDELSSETGLSFRVLSGLREPVLVKRGRTWGTVVIRGLSGPDLYRQGQANLLTPARAVMIAFYEGTAPGIDECVGAGVLNLTTRQMVIAAPQTPLVMRWFGRLDKCPIAPSADSGIVYCAATDKVTRLGTNQLSPDFRVVGDVPSAGVRFLNVAAGNAAATIGWAGNGDFLESMIGISLVVLAGGVVLDATGSDFAALSLETTVGEGTGFIATADQEIAKIIHDRLGTSV